MDERRLHASGTRWVWMKPTSSWSCSRASICSCEFSSLAHAGLTPLTTTDTLFSIRHVNRYTVLNMRQEQPLPFEVAQQIHQLGQRIRLARVRRRMSQDELAKTCQIARTTLHRIEAGAPGVAIGALYTVLWTLGLLSTASGVADPDLDDHGKILEAARQAKRVRRPSDKPDENDF